MAYGISAYKESNSTQKLRLALGYCLELLAQRWQWHLKKVNAGDRIPAGRCLCGCHEQVTGSPYGKPRLFVSDAHRQRAGRRRRKRERAQASANGMTV